MVVVIGRSKLILGNAVISRVRKYQVYFVIGPAFKSVVVVVINDCR